MTEIVHHANHMKQKVDLVEGLTHGHIVAASVAAAAGEEEVVVAAVAVEGMKMLCTVVLVLKVEMMIVVATTISYSPGYFQHLIFADQSSLNSLHPESTLQLKNLKHQKNKQTVTDKNR